MTSTSECDKIILLKKSQEDEVLMRVIAGSARRRNLVCPSGEKTRPTTDRIKETLFNMLQTEVIFRFVQWQWWDWH